MLPDRILATLRFFDLQDMPLTLFELHKFLLPDLVKLEECLDDNYEVIEPQTQTAEVVSLSEVLSAVLSLADSGQVGQELGYYCLPGRLGLIKERLYNHRFGIVRERLVRRFAGGCRFLPFIRGVAIGGSQALGPERSTSDIDLFIITDERFFWLARTFITSYFQLLGKRRHGQKIANRFCLNHYISGPKSLTKSLDLYQATDVVKFRPVTGRNFVSHFQKANQWWVQIFFPNFSVGKTVITERPFLQRVLEKIFINRFGLWLEQKLGSWQMKRIKRGEFIVAEPGEISFHSKQKKQQLFKALFGKNVSMKF